MNQTCCFTGHRPKGFSFGYNENNQNCLKIKNMLNRQIEILITEKKVTHFISGMALGVDQ